MVKTIKDENQMIEAEIMKMMNILQNGETNELKRKARKEILRLEKHLRDKENEYLNGKKYPERLYHSDDKPMNKSEIFKLIDSVDESDVHPYRKMTEKETRDWINSEIDLSGVFVSDDRTTEFARTSILDLYKHKE